MTRKDRFMQVINEKGYESVIQLMIAVESIIEGDKEFPAKYIVALEKVLDMRFVDMINPNA